MKPKEYDLMQDTIEAGIDWGWRHAHKHVQNPGEEAIKEQICHDVMNEIGERWNFEDPGGEE